MTQIDTQTAVRPTPFIPMTRKDGVRVVLYGAIAGVTTVVLYVVLERFVLAALLCREATVCTQAHQYASIVAAVLGSIVGLALLSRARLYRPLFIVIAAVAALWGLQNYVVLMSWYLAALTVVLLVTVTYALFAWLARLRSFVLYLVISIILIVIARLIIAG